MLTHYIDIKVLPDPEFSRAVLMNALYAKLHRALVSLHSTTIGVAFPEYEKSAISLGGRLRLYGEKSHLENLMQQAWLKGMHDHVQMTGILELPLHAECWSVRRRHAKSNVERLRRRQMKRHQWTEAVAIEKLPEGIEEKLKLPFIKLRSASTSQDFRLFIMQQKEGRAVDGDFNSYGLSRTATLPSF